jgi:hypothetical protein
VAVLTAELNSTTVMKSEEELLKLADELVNEERLLQAARILRQVDQSHLTERHRKILNNAGVIEYVSCVGSLCFCRPSFSDIIICDVVVHYLLKK